MISRSIAAAILLATALFAFGCGGDDDGPPTEQPSPFGANAQTPNPTSTATPTVNTPSEYSSVDRIAFFGLKGNFFLDEARLNTVNLDGSGQKTLTTRANWTRPAAWSPDGGQLAFESGQRINVMNADGSNTRELTDRDMYAGDPVWSPDGSTIAFAASPGNVENIYIMNSDGSQQRRVTDNIIATGETPYPAFSSLSWSSDGTMIAFERADDVTTPRKVYIVQLNGQVEAEFRGSNPVFSPRGTQLAYFDDHSLQIRNSDGTVTILQGAGLGDIAWSSDGKRIAYIELLNSTLSVLTLSGDPPELSVRVTLPGAKGKPSWSPDGVRLAYRGSDGIYILDADGSTSLLIADDTRDKFRFDLPAWSPAQ